MEFTKMQGIGNDYVYVDCFKEKVEHPGEVSKYVSDRHFGIGSDGLILICPSDKADCRMDMYNADGSQGIMCGNGVRCVGKYVYDHGIVDKDRRIITVETLGGIKTLDIQVEDGKAVMLTVDMGEAELTSKLPEKIVIDGTEQEFTGISVGNPHAVYFTEGINDLDLEKIGPSYENHPRFQPARVNSEFIEVKSRDHIRMRVWERGSGETWACGTGATASAVASMMLGLVDDTVEVQLIGGNLEITWDRESNHVYMTGPAVEVFSGEIDLTQYNGREV